LDGSILSLVGLAVVLKLLAHLLLRLLTLPSFAGAVGAIFGLSAPLSIGAPTVMLAAQPQQHHMNAVVFGSKLTHDLNSDMTDDPSVFGSSNDNEMSFRFLASIPTIVHNGALAADGTIVIPTHPAYTEDWTFAASSVDTTAYSFSKVTGGYLWHLSTQHQFYSGSLKMLVVVFGSALGTGRLRIRHVPNAVPADLDSGVTGEYAQDLDTQVHVITGMTIIEFSVPSNNHTIWNEILPYHPYMEKLTEHRTCYHLPCGAIVFDWLEAPVFPSTISTPDIPITIYMAGGDDFRFTGYRPVNRPTLQAEALVMAQAVHPPVASVLRDVRPKKAQCNPRAEFVKEFLTVAPGTKYRAECGLTLSGDHVNSYREAIKEMRLDQMLHVDPDSDLVTANGIMDRPTSTVMWFWPPVSRLRYTQAGSPAADHFIPGLLSINNTRCFFNSFNDALNFADGSDLASGMLTSPIVAALRIFHLYRGGFRVRVRCGADTETLQCVSAKSVRMDML